MDIFLNIVRLDSGYLVLTPYFHHKNFSLEVQWRILLRNLTLHSNACPLKVVFSKNLARMEEQRYFGLNVYKGGRGIRMWILIWVRSNVRFTRCCMASLAWRNSLSGQPFGGEQAYFSRDQGCFGYPGCEGEIDRGEWTDNDTELDTWTNKTTPPV